MVRLVISFILGEVYSSVNPARLSNKLAPINLPLIGKF